MNFSKCDVAVLYRAFHHRHEVERSPSDLMNFWNPAVTENDPFAYTGSSIKQATCNDTAMILYIPPGSKCSAEIVHKSIRMHTTWRSA